MSDATLYRAAATPIAVATIEAISGYDMARPMLGTIHEPPVPAGQSVHRQALRFGTREGDLTLVLGGPDAAERADAVDEALRLNGLIYLDCPHFPQLHLVRWAVAGAYRIAHARERGARTWIVTVPVKEMIG